MQPRRANIRIVPTEGIEALAVGRWFESARDGKVRQGQRSICRLPGERKTLTERDRDRALLEIHSELRRGTRGFTMRAYFPRVPSASRGRGADNLLLLLARG
jgi:hypothetical protein